MDIEEVRFNGRIPAIAYTDFTKIYLSWSLTGKQLEVARIHELSHIWLGHRLRLQTLKEEKGEVNHTLWNIAADLEIAKHIYTPEHNKTIKAPFSFLKNCITTEDTEKYVSEYAEGYYDELLEEKQDQQEGKSFDGDGNDFSGEDSKEGTESKEEVVAKAKSTAEEFMEKQAERSKCEQLHEKMKSFNPPKPSLASEMDMVFGRTKLSRVSSYRRPNRIESEFIIKGEVSKKKQPKLTVYVDRSGSFDDSKTLSATRRLEEVMKKYRGRILHDTIYFNDKLLKLDPKEGDGGTNYEAVIDYIMTNKSELNVVITDDDFCPDFQGKLPKTIVIPVGCKNTVFAEKTRSVEVE